MDRKIIDIAALSHFLKLIETWVASNFVTRIIYDTLPTEYNYIGRQCFLTSDEHNYVYTSTGWRKVPYEDEALFENDSSGNVIMK